MRTATFHYTPDQVMLTHDEKPRIRDEYAEYTEIARTTDSRENFDFFCTALAKKGLPIPKNKHGFVFRKTNVNKARLYRNKVTLRTMCLNQYFPIEKLQALYQEEGQIFCDFAEQYRLTDDESFLALYVMMDAAAEVHQEYGIGGLIFMHYKNYTLATLLSKHSLKPRINPLQQTHPELIQKLYDLVKSIPKRDLTEFVNNHLKEIEI